MPSLQNLPSSKIIGFTTEIFSGKYSHPARTIYLLVATVAFAGLALLPLIEVDISVKSKGILRANAETSILRSASSGIVTKILVSENATVQHGQLLIAVGSPLLDEKEVYLKCQLSDVTDLLNDVNTLLRDTAGHELKTSLYRQALTEHKLKLKDRQIRFRKARADFERNEKLFNQQVIAAVEFENFRFELNKGDEDVKLLREAQYGVWQQDAYRYQKEKKEYENSLAQLINERDALNIRAPISGNIQNLSGIYAGSVVVATQELGAISPDGSLIAEIYVSPRDIGMLRSKMPVRIQMDAFDYNEWGLASGTITEISSDVHVNNSQPVFKVRCKLDQNFLALKNGYRGLLKKGMTLQARFIVTRRTLWQLLYDRSDDWINPNLISNDSH